MNCLSLRIFGGALLRPTVRCQHFHKQNMSSMDNSLHSNGKIFESMAEAISDIRDGSRVMIGGFGPCGEPDNLIKAILDRGCKDLIIVIIAIAKSSLITLMEEHRIKRLITSFIGRRRELQKLYHSGQVEVELVPQGTLVERIRAAGAGIPAFYTPIGYGTAIQDGQFVIKYDNAGNPEIYAESKNVSQLNGRNCVLETALDAEFAVVKAWKADKSGNLIFRKSARNSNPTMCKASKVTIVEVEEIVEIGQLNPDQIHVPGIYVDRIVHAPVSEEQEKTKKMFIAPKLIKSNDIRSKIMRRAVLEIKDGMYVNLGHGMPMMAADLISKNIKVLIHSDSGILGMGPSATEDQIDIDLINASIIATSVVSGASFFESVDIFALVRGGHLDLTILGSMEVSEKGDLANWMIPKTMVQGMGGAMDLISASKTKVVVTMEHKTPDGSPKILKNCTLPLTGYQCVDMIITDLAVFEVRKGRGLRLIETAPNTDINEIVNSTGCEFEISNDLKVMGQVETDDEGK